MNKQHKINTEVEKTLTLLENAEPIKADAYFYTRLKARMDAEARDAQLAGFLPGWKIWVPAFMLVMLVVNIYTASIFLGTNNTTNHQEELANLFVTELTLDSSQYNPTVSLE